MRTIETSLLIPVLLFVYSFLVYIGLFQYNQCLLQSNTYILGLDTDAQIYSEKYLLAEEIENFQVYYETNDTEPKEILFQCKYAEKIIEAMDGGRN